MQGGFRLWRSLSLLVAAAVVAGVIVPPASAEHLRSSGAVYGGVANEQEARSYPCPEAPAGGWERTGPVVCLAKQAATWVLERSRVQPMGHRLVRARREDREGPVRSPIVRPARGRRPGRHRRSPTRPRQGHRLRRPRPARSARPATPRIDRRRCRPTVWRHMESRLRSPPAARPQLQARPALM